MTRLLISVEGFTEKRFVESILAPHLHEYDVFVKIHNMKGNVSVDRIKSKFKDFLYNFDYVTTLYDFYGFGQKSQDEAKDGLEDKIKDKFDEGIKSKLIPYIQMYEFEALLFSCIEKMTNCLDTEKD